MFPRFPSLRHMWLKYLNEKRSGAVSLYRVSYQTQLDEVAPAKSLTISQHQRSWRIKIPQRRPRPRTPLYLGRVAVRIWEERSQENPRPPMESANSCQQQ